ncbi:hypothetical protein DFH27DRAFT_605957 [Peziza echinospora]|nr:hypothetical protein DFH27DRAFT_605957 [Peziza echinospora]
MTSSSGATSMTSLDSNLEGGQLITVPYSILQQALTVIGSTGGFKVQDPAVRSSQPYTPSISQEPGEDRTSEEHNSDDGHKRRAKRAFVPYRPMVIPSGGSSKYVSKVPTLAQYESLSWREQLSVRMGSWGDRQETMNRSAAFKAAMQNHTNGINLDRPYEDYDYKRVMRPNLKRAQVKMESLYGWPADLYVCTDLAIRICTDKSRNDHAKQSRKLTKEANKPNSRRVSDPRYGSKSNELGIDIQKSKRRRVVTTELVQDSDDSTTHTPIQSQRVIETQYSQNSVNPGNAQENTPDEEEDPEPTSGYSFIIEIKKGPSLHVHTTFNYEKFMSVVKEYAEINDDEFVWYVLPGNRNPFAMGDKGQYSSMIERIEALYTSGEYNEERMATVKIKPFSVADEQSEAMSSEDEMPRPAPVVAKPSVYHNPLQETTNSPQILIPSTQPVIPSNILRPTPQPMGVVPVMQSQQASILVPATQSVHMYSQPSTFMVPSTEQENMDGNRFTEADLIDSMTGSKRALKADVDYTAAKKKPQRAPAKPKAQPKPKAVAKAKAPDSPIESVPKKRGRKSNKQLAEEALLASSQVPVGTPTSGQNFATAMPPPNVPIKIPKLKLNFSRSQSIVPATQLDQASQGMATPQSQSQPAFPSNPNA